MRTRTWGNSYSMTLIFPSVFSDDLAEGEELNRRCTETPRGSVYLLKTMRGEVAKENQRINNLF